jgi:3-mercaptopyruvate sulfurtransferase SseA
MRNSLRYWLAAAAAAFLPGLQPALAAPASASPLVSVQWLQQNREDVLLLDASMTPEHKANHIPGAVSVDLFSYGPPMRVATSQMEARIQSWGVSPGKKIVIYDAGGSNMATWLFFELHYHGVPAESLSILDGGLAKWQASGGPVTKEASAPPPKGTFRMTKTREEERVRLAEFVNAWGDRANHALVDAMEPTYYYGAVKFFDRYGHVPNAVMLPGSDFYNADKTFKSPEEIRRMAEYLGIKPDQQINSYCGGGVAATVPYFALKFIAGYPKAKVYKESMFEWLQDERQLPFWTYDAPALKREASWLNGWNSRMLRMYGVGNVSVVDVRPAEAFTQNHLPYALNVPAELFKANLDNPAKLAELLGPSGVNPAHEAVIVSAGGLNPQSALAFAMLEKLGQKKVSVLMGSVDDWGIAGYPLTKEPTIVGRPQKPQDMAVAPASYPANVRGGVMIKDAGTSKGSYPKVFVASGKTVPARTQDGKVVHVPYTDLVNADGTPKAAGEIWNVLVKAGVPRYAEIILFSDDPGEAAVNYVVFRMMGYPDVKLAI